MCADCLVSPLSASIKGFHQCLALQSLCRILESAAKCLGTTVNAVQKAAGEYFATWVEENGYGNLLRALGHNVVEFLVNLNALHLHLSVGWPAMRPPMFAVEQVGKGNAKSPLAESTAAAAGLSA